MMNLPSIDLQQLATRQQEPCISMYLPTGARQAESAQGKIRLKNMLRATEERIREMGVSDSSVRQSMTRAYGFVDDSTFWTQGGRGLAMFIAPELFQYYLLPREFQELLVVSERFHLKPLIPLISGNVEFYILRPSQKRPRLFRCNSYRIEEIADAGLPENMEQALKEEYPGDLNMRSVPAVVDGSGKLVHGHGGGMESEKEKYVRYSRLIDGSLRERLMKDKLPLILMGVRYERDLYRLNNSYPHLVNGGVEGTFQSMTPAELHDKALEAIRPYYEKQELRAREKFAEKKAAGLASNDVEEIVPAAASGRVDYIFVGLGVQCWGTFEAQQNKAHCHDRQYTGDMDLLDFAASQTFLHGGTVYAVKSGDVPGTDGRCPIAAAYRY